MHGDDPCTLGEDFSGSAALSRAWVELGSDRRAVAVDHDPEPLAHARSRLRAEERVSLREADVLAVDDPADVIAALNFSVCEHHTRGALLAYLRHVRSRLRPGGVFVADLYGGAEAELPGAFRHQKRTPEGAFTYTWEQGPLHPLTRRVTNAIHFALPGGRELRDAFRYDWRLWTVPELQDALADAGFPTVEHYTNTTEGEDERGYPCVQPVTDAAALDEPGDDWVVYVVGRVV